VARTWANGIAEERPKDLKSSNMKGTWSLHEKILELGAGIGALGIAMARQARCVVVTDIDLKVLRLASANARVNDLPATKLQTAKLAYGREPALDFRDTWGRFDRIVGADIIYSKSAIPVVLESVYELLTDKGVFSLGFVARESSFAPTLERTAREFGFKLARPTCRLADALAEDVAESTMSKKPTHSATLTGTLAQLKAALTSIRKGGAFLGEAEEKVELFEFQRCAVAQFQCVQSSFLCSLD